VRLSGMNLKTVERENMANVIAYGVYVPLWRLDLGSLPGGGQGERAIANFDEDSLTMG